jgi:hypothetical protein
MKRWPLIIWLTMLGCFFLAGGCTDIKDRIEKTLPWTGGPETDKGETLSLFVNTGLLHLRACAGLNCQILATLKRGEEVLKIGEDGEWMKVQLKNSKNEGWVASRYLSSAPPKPVPPPSPGRESTKPQEEWAGPDKGTKPSSSRPQEDFAK